MPEFCESRHIRIFDSRAQILREGTYALIRFGAHVNIGLSERIQVLAGEYSVSRMSSLRHCLCEG